MIEDSIAGIEAAKAAGMLCVAVTNTYSYDRLTLADRVVRELSEINLENL